MAHAVVPLSAATIECIVYLQRLVQAAFWKKQAFFGKNLYNAGSESPYTHDESRTVDKYIL